MQAFEYLEREWAEFCGMEHCVACSSGTAALHLALEALELSLGSRVIVPEYTMIACARAVTLAGLKPVFVDCRNDLLMDDGDPMGNATVEHYSAAMMVHIYGRRMDMDWISSTCGVCHPVVEDLSEAHGVKPHETTDAACWSFYKNKIIHGEEGGMVAFRNPEHAARARQLRSLGFTDAHDFLHIPRGHNYRMSNLHAQAVRKCLSWYPEIAEDRRQIEAWYNEHVPAEWHMPPRDAVWVYDLRIPGLEEWQQNMLVNDLNIHDVRARHAFKPMSRQPEYIGEYEHLNAHRLSREVIYLPVQPGMTEDDVARAAGILELAVESVMLNPPSLRP